MQRYLSVKMASVVCCAVLFPAALQPKSRPVPLATIPLEPYLRAQATVHAVVNGKPGTFLFDTGEGVSSFFAQLCREDRMPSLGAGSVGFG